MSDRLKTALRKIAKGSSGYRAGGGYFCDWCMQAGAEEFSDTHPTHCPRTIARKAIGIGLKRRAHQGGNK